MDAFQTYITLHQGDGIQFGRVSANISIDLIFVMYASNKNTKMMNKDATINKI